MTKPEAALRLSVDGDRLNEDSLKFHFDVLLPNQISGTRGGAYS